MPGTRTGRIEMGQEGKAYLQVMLNNPVALHLYDKLGFKEIYRYWYRNEPPDLSGNTEFEEI